MCDLDAIGGSRIRRRLSPGGGRVVDSRRRWAPIAAPIWRKQRASFADTSLSAGTPSARTRRSDRGEGARVCGASPRRGPPLRRRTTGGGGRRSARAARRGFPEPGVYGDDPVLQEARRLHQIADALFGGRILVKLDEHPLDDVEIRNHSVDSRAPDRRGRPSRFWRRTSCSRNGQPRNGVRSSARGTAALSTEATSAVMDDIGSAGISTASASCSRMYEVACEGETESLAERFGSVMEARKAPPVPTLVGDTLRSTCQAALRVRSWEMTGVGFRAYAHLCGSPDPRAIQCSSPPSVDCIRQPAVPSRGSRDHRGMHA